LDQTPRSRQTLLFSATLDGAVDAVVRDYQRNPIRHVLPDVEVAQAAARHVWWRVERDERTQVCADVVRLAGPSIVFCKTKHGADALAKKLGRLGVPTRVIHGNRSQSQRERALADFATGTVGTLIATDVVARGIHVDDVACIVNFDLPHDEKDYVHRAGRTARAGASGVVVTFVVDDQGKTAARLRRVLGHAAQPQAPTRRDLASLVPTPSGRAEGRSPREEQRGSRPAPAEAVPGAPPDGTHAAGTSKWYDARRGCGFISRPGHDDVFVHSKSIRADQQLRIEEGQPVRYRVGAGRRGPEARQVQLALGGPGIDDPI